MNAQTYPGDGLSLSQLTFALNEELKRAAYSTSFDFEKVSQFEQDTSAALSTIREWRNSFIPINRIPLDILSLVPTYLTSQNDRLRATFVCRHWRRTLLQRAELWSQLFLSKGEVYVKTLLERAGGSVLDITVAGSDDYDCLQSKITLLSSHTRQIGRLEFLPTSWAIVHMFSGISGPLPLLQTLEIATLPQHLPGHSRLPLFNNATNLKVFSFDANSNRLPFLNCFLFPNLTSFHFSTSPSQIFHASQILDFLETSPMLQTVHLEVITDISLHQVLQRNVVVLPNVETFKLVVSDGKAGYKMAAQISCPSAKLVSLTHKVESDNTISEDLFPAPGSWDAIVSQYSRSPVEEASLDIRAFPILTCKLSFLSPGQNVIELCSYVAEENYGEGPGIPSVATRDRVFAQATRTVRNHPQLENLRRLYICHNHRSVGSRDFPYPTSDVDRLFKSVGPLDELIISRSDLRPYFYSSPKGPVVFPKIKEFTISHSVNPFPRECTTVIVAFARRQHASGIPLERVIICEGSLPTGIVEGLRPWVGSVEYRYEES